MIDERERYERAFQEFQMPEPAWDRLVGRRDRKRRNKRIAAGVVGIAVFVAAVWVVTSGGGFDRTHTPAAEESTPTVSPTPSQSPEWRVIASGLLTLPPIPPGSGILRVGGAVDLEQGPAQPTDRPRSGCDLVRIQTETPSTAILASTDERSEPPCSGSAPVLLGDGSRRLPVWLDVVDFDALSADDLRRLDWYYDPIVVGTAVDRFGTNRVRWYDPADRPFESHSGDVYAIRTDAGNYTKLQIVEIGRRLTFRYITYGDDRPPEQPT